jgi:hypothetical protein
MTKPSIQYRKATPADVEGILRLQNQNLITTLEGKDLSQGFLTIPLSKEQIYRISSEHGIFVAHQGTDVIGYMMEQSVEIAIGSPLIAYMISRLKEYIYEGFPLASCKLFVHGPVCIEKQYRGKGVLDQLFKFMLQELKCDVGIGFVSAQNPRSYNAHKNKLGLQVIDEFEFGAWKYFTLAFAVSQKERK